MFEKIYRVDHSGVQQKVSARDLQIMVDNDQVQDLNLIYRSNTKSAFVAFRLASWVSQTAGKAERVTKFLVELGTYDASRPKGSRQKEYIQIYLGEDDFSFFISLMRNARILDIMDRCERRGEKIPYKHHNGKGDAKRLRMYRGSKMPVILEAAQGPGRDGGNGQTIPDNWDGHNKDKVRKAMIALSEEEVVKIGEAGARAMQILDMWRAFGRDEENLALINIKKQSRQDGAGYQGSRQTGRSYQGSSYGRRDNDAYRRGYAAEQAAG